ncbi:MAG: hypothetical protein ACRC2T_06385 [Thermoguttaceae bacterium]
MMTPKPEDDFSFIAPVELSPQTQMRLEKKRRAARNLRIVIALSTTLVACVGVLVWLLTR